MKKENTVCIYVDVRGQPVDKDWQILRLTQVSCSSGKLVQTVING